MDRTARRLAAVYEVLLSTYGPQGWWPLRSRAGTPGFDERGYHRLDYEAPRGPAERFEVAVGAALAQATAWRNVESALDALLAEGLLEPERLARAPQGEVAGLIRSAGYFNQKARKLHVLARFFVARGSSPEAPERQELLGLWGVGPETADSILLYGYHSLQFVVDAYTRRLLERLGAASANSSYSELQGLLASAVAREEAVYNEYHALIVRHAKDHCRRVPLCEGCPLAGLCPLAGPDRGAKSTHNNRPV